MRYFRRLNPLRNGIEIPAGRVYICNHPIYDRCTLYTAGQKGLAVVQQKHDPRTKYSWWGEIDDRTLVNDIYEADGFDAFFARFAALPDKTRLYPTVTVRQIMWALRMKPLPRERWETVFDHKPL